MSESPADIPAAPAERSLAIVVPMAAMMFLVIADHLIMQPLIPTICHDFEVGTEWTPRLAGSYSIAAGCFALLMGPWSDRFGRARLIRILAVGFCLANLCCGLAGNVHQFLAARILAGLFGGPLGSTMNAYVGDLFQGDRRTKAVGWFSLGFPLAVVVAVPIGAAIGGQYGWQTVCFSLAALAVPMAVGSFRFPHIHIPRINKSIVREYLEMIGVLFHRRGWPFFISFLLIMSTFFGYVVNIAVWLESNQGLENTEHHSLSWIYLCGGLGSILGALIFRPLVKIFGKVELLAGSALLSGIMVYFLVTRPLMSSHAVLFTLFFCSHFSGSLRRPLAGLIAIDLAPEQVRGRFLAMMNITFSLSFAVAAAWTHWVLVYPDPAKGIVFMEHADWMALGIIAGTLAAWPTLWIVRREIRQITAAQTSPAPVAAEDLA